MVLFNKLFVRDIQGGMYVLESICCKAMRYCIKDMRLDGQ